MAFKSARLFSPSKINTNRPSPSDINNLSVLPFLSSPVIEELKREVPLYLAQAEDVSPSVDPIVWWRDHAQRLPHWSQACKFITLIQPSSAAAESVLTSSKLFQQQPRKCSRGLPLLCYNITIVEINDLFFNFEQFMRIMGPH